MKRVYYFLIVGVLILVIAFFGIRNASVQNFLIDLIFESQLNNQDKRITFEGDYVIGLVCGSRGPLPGEGGLNHAS